MASQFWLKSDTRDTMSLFALLGYPVAVVLGDSIMCVFDWFADPYQNSRTSAPSSSVLLATLLYVAKMIVVDHDTNSSACCLL